MKKMPMIFLLILASVFISCDLFDIVEGNGNAISQDYTETGFNKVHVGSLCDAEIRYGTDYSVRVTADSNIIQYVEVTESDGVLTVVLDDSERYGSVDVTVYITLPALEELATSGSTKAEVLGEWSFTNANLTLLADDFSEIDIDPDSSMPDAVLSGNLALATADTAWIDARDLAVQGDAEIQMGGVTRAYINVQGSVRGNLRGAAELFHVGDLNSGGLDVEDLSSIERL